MAGLYGPVSIDQWDGRRLPYVDNLVNLLVVEQAGDMGQEEMLRVLAPDGVAWVRRGDRWEKTIKPRPDTIDEWTHYLHDASGNAVAHDTVVAPPRQLQWIGSPRWSRHHDRMASLSAMVSSAGRLFYIMDEGSRISIQLPPKWTLVARDAFNGTILWKRAIDSWHHHLWPLKSGPTQLARRLVAEDGLVFVTLGLRAPLTALDAATGDVIRHYADTGSTEEIICQDGMLFLLVNRGESELTSYLPQQNVGDQQRVGQDFRWNELPREVMAVDARTGQTLWSHTSPVAPLTLAADSQRVYFHDGTRLVCLDRKDGQIVWSSEPVQRRDRIAMHFGPKLVVQPGIVLFAGGDRMMQALDAATGQLLWSAPHGGGGYQSPQDLLVVNGLIWSAPTSSGNDTGIFTGRDLLSGDVKREFAPDVDAYWFHHRCYMAKATDRFLLPSRTGIEFVDYQQQHWDINHWVRGGCLYGIMPCNGLVYTPPHDCTCYPETKLFGLNALAPDRPNGRQGGSADIDADRRQPGPAFGRSLEVPDDSPTQTAGDWPTYRRDAMRSGYTPHAVSPQIELSWQSEFSGSLSAPIVAQGRLYVAEMDTHTVHALDAVSGQRQWNFTAGGRVDSPPTVDRGRVLFGSADGWVYCLAAADGNLIWRFRGAPQDQRLMAFEQLESVWPIHGSVLVRDDTVYAVAGRSYFLDGGLRLIQLHAGTGELLSEKILDSRDPETGNSLQQRMQILNMPVGLPDVLSGNDRYVFMRSQAFDLAGNRLEVGPHSGNPAEQGSVQHGDTAHLFAPMGFLDDTWFHRSYWVYGRSFAGGHAGYYQAGRYTPAGRILVFDDEQVYGFGRKPQYYRWTTTMEHQLFATPKDAPEVDQQALRRGAGDTLVRFKKTRMLDPRNKPVTVQAWIKAEKPNGVILARGGPSHGFALLLRNGRPRFSVRTNGQIHSVAARESVVGKWTHLVGTLQGDAAMRLYVNGQVAATGKAAGLLTNDPAQPMEIGADEAGAVGNYNTPFGFTGIIDQVQLDYGELSDAEVLARFRQPDGKSSARSTLVLACSFDDGTAQDESGCGHDGEIQGAEITEGKFGKALQFRARATQAGDTFVRFQWTKDLPLLARAMVLTDRTLFVAGPPDLVDEEESFRRLTLGDAGVWQELSEQDQALAGSRGGRLWAVSATDGEKQAAYELPFLPVWDGMIAAHGRLFLSTADGQVVSYRAMTGQRGQ